jgi:protein-S-isoprenylcysteine O-methyltransferase Ste14
MTGILREIFRRLIGSEIDASVSLFKIESAIVYLNLIKGTRGLARILCMLVVSVIVLACGFLLIPVALCLFMPWDPRTKAIVAAAFGAAYVIFPLIALTVLLSEKRWMKASKADKLVREALKG